MSSSSSYSVNSSTSSSGTTRVTGLYSTLDVDSLVKASLTYDQSRIDTLKQTMQYNEWKQDAYRTVNTLMSDFQSKYLDVSNKNTTVLLKSEMSARTVTLSDSSACRVSATSNVQVDNFKIYGTKLATKASAISENKFTDMNLAMKVGEFKASIDSSYTYNPDVPSEFTVSINGENISFKEDDTVAAMMSKVNNSKAGVKMTYNELNNRFEINSTATGATAKVEISGDNSGIFCGGDNSIFGSGDSYAKSGSDATVMLKVGNDLVVKTSSSNIITTGGVTFTITDDYNAENIDKYNEDPSNFGIDNVVGSAISANIKTDVDSIVNRITNFIKDYNTLYSSLYGLITERKDYDYEPLKESEKEKMSESEIAKWETKAKAGILYGDSTIRSTLDSLRSTFSSVFTNSDVIGNDGKVTMSSIGISTGNYYSSKVGEIVIDEAKLREAIEKDPNAVADMFTSSTLPSTSGLSLGQKFKQVSNNFVSTVKNTIISNLSLQHSRYEDKLSLLEEKFAKREDDLYSEYSYLDVLISQMSSSASMFTTS